MNTSRLSQARLDRMHDVMTSHVERGEAPGMVTLLCRHDEIHVDAIGAKAFGDSDPMQRDSILRISSMTKPIAAVAAMILVEDGMLGLDDPVDQWLPELADRRVLKRLDGPVDDTVPAHRLITLRDLLTMHLGFGFIMEPGEFPIQGAATELGVMPGPPAPQTPPSPDEWIRRFATLPLMHQPGEQWGYDTAFHVLGVLLSRVADQPLETFLRERIFEPLGMNDTGFSVPAAERDRLATCYTSDPETGSLELYDGVDDSQWSCPPAFPDAAGGLVSTVDDYLAFGQMMLKRGTYGSERILSSRAVELMTTNQLTAEQKEAAGFFLEDRVWGLGMSIVTTREGAAGGAGRFGWDGGLGTSWYSDPKEDMVAILMTQRLPPSWEIFSDFWTLAYQAIED